MLRRRLTAPGPTPLRTQTTAEDDTQESGDLASEMSSDVNPMLALVPSLTQPMQGLRLAGLFAQFAEALSAFAWSEAIAVTAFLFKLLLLVIPCSPYVCSAGVLYPLLGLACLDLIL